MVVIGLLLGASAWLSRALDERRQLQQEMQRLEIVRDAIVGYAIRNRTRERILKVVPWFGPKGNWEFRLPAGRPYLPCPDFDGDGYEDRMPRWAFPQGTETKPDLTVTVTIGELAPPRNGHLTWTQGSSSYPEAHPYGECRVERGGVPWRTLGVAPSDGWGNRHTYFADPTFSNAIFGFDRQTVADIYDPRVPSAPGYGPSLRHFRDIYSDLRTLDMPNAPPMLLNNSPENCPAAICIGNSACEPTQLDSFRIPDNVLESARRCAWQFRRGPEQSNGVQGRIGDGKRNPRTQILSGGERGGRLCLLCWFRTAPTGVMRSITGPLCRTGRADLGVFHSRFAILLGKVIMPSTDFPTFRRRTAFSILKR